MRKIALIGLALLFAGFALTGGARAGVDIGLSLDSDGIKGFYLAIGDHYQVPEKEIVFVREKKFPDEEMPVVFFLARHANVTSQVIISLRLGGKSWMDICTHYHLSPDLFYVPLKHDPGPPYGKAWGHFKNKKRKKNDWGSIRFSDADIVNFVNLKFVSEKYGYSPDEVIKMRSGGSDFVAIHGKVKKAKKNHKKAAAKHASSDDERQKGKKKKGKGKNK
ncbi:MAG: hypothetical protein V3T31_10770 [candidate division Zixibacteria bacterium]